jgi:hypothetical protein
MRHGYSLLAASTFLFTGACLAEDADEVTAHTSELGNVPDPGAHSQVTDATGACWDQPPGLTWLQGFRCHTGANQGFVFQQVAAGVYQVHPASDRFQCLDIPNASPGSGVALQMFPCHGRVNQQWTVTPVNASFALIKSVMSSSLCLDIQAGVTPQKLQLYTCHGGVNQTFRFRTRVGTGGAAACPGNLFIGGTTVIPGAVASFPATGNVQVTCNTTPPRSAFSGCSRLTNWIVVDRSSGTGVASIACFRQ